MSPPYPITTILQNSGLHNPLSKVTTIKWDTAFSNQFTVSKSLMRWMGSMQLPKIWSAVSEQRTLRVHPRRSLGNPSAPRGGTAHLNLGGCCWERSDQRTHLSLSKWEVATRFLRSGKVHRSFSVYGSKLLRNDVPFPPDYTASHGRRQYSSQSQLKPNKTERSWILNTEYLYHTQKNIYTARRNLLKGFYFPSTCVWPCRPMKYNSRATSGTRTLATCRWLTL
jgi:hypothetical protein